MNPTSKRTAATLFTVFTVTAMLFADTSHASAGVRKRPVRGAATTLTVVATDASTSRPIHNVQISVNDNIVGKTDPSGKFTLPSAKAGSAIVLLERVGYDPVTRTIDIKSGSNALNVSLTPRPVATLQTIDGATRTVDYTSLEFGFSITFAGYQKAPRLEVCKNGEAQTIQKAQIRSINGPATVGAGGTCCTFPQAQHVSITLKTGETFDATLKDSCPGYTMDVITNDRETGEPIFVPFTQVKKLDLP